MPRYQVGGGVGGVPLVPLVPLVLRVRRNKVFYMGDASFIQLDEKIPVF